MVFIQEIDNLPRIKDGACVINIDEYSDVGTHWLAIKFFFKSALNLS